MMNCLPFRQPAADGRRRLPNFPARRDTYSLRSTSFTLPREMLFRDGTPYGIRRQDSASYAGSMHASSSPTDFDGR